MIKFTYKELRIILNDFDLVINEVDTEAIVFSEGLSDECKRNIKQLLLFDDDTLNNDDDINRILVKTLIEFYDFFVRGFDIPNEEILMSIAEKLRFKYMRKKRMNLMNNNVRKYDDYIVWDKNVKNLLVNKGFEVIGTIKGKKEKDSLGYKFKKSKEFFNALNLVRNGSTQEDKTKKFEEMIEKFKAESEEKSSELSKREERY